MESGDTTYIWKSGTWPGMTFDLAVLAGPMTEAGRAQGRLMGRLADISEALRDQAPRPIPTSRAWWR